MNAIRRFLDSNPSLDRLYRNAGIVFGGNASASLIAIAVVAVATRALPLNEFGTYTLVIAYVNLVDRLVSFQTWQALIHFGAKARQEQDTALLASLFGFGWLLDIGSSFLGFAIALIGAIIVPSWFGLGDNGLTLAAIGASALLVNWVATPIALLRLYDRFYLQALYQQIQSGLMLALFIMLWLAGVQSLTAFVAANAVARIAGRLSLVVLALREARKQGVYRPDLVNFQSMFGKAPGLWKFVLTTNLDGMVRVVRDLDMFIVNAILGPSAVALYKVARVLARAFGQLTGPFFQAIYPELAGMIAKGEMREFKRLIWQSSITLGVIVGVAWIGFLTVGQWAIPIAFGNSYSDAFAVTAWCLAGMVVWAVAQPLSPAMMALGRVGLAATIHASCSVMYIGLIWVLGRRYGLVGTGVAVLAFQVAWFLCSAVAVKRNLQLRVYS